MITFLNVALNKDWGQSESEIYSSSALALISASRASKSVCWMGSDLDGKVPWGRFVPLGGVGPPFVLGGIFGFYNRLILDIVEYRFDYHRVSIFCGH